jgi:opacity protein-like surface antigen
MIVDLDDDIPEAPDESELTIDGGVFTANVKGTLPFDRIQPYALVGLGGMWARLRSTYATGAVCTPTYWGWWCEGTYTSFGNNGAFAMKLGGGTDVYITDDWAITLDASYVMPFGNLEDLRYVNFAWGARFRF